MALYSINTVVVKEQVLKLLSIFFFVEVFSKLSMGQNVVFVTLDPIQFLINKSLCVIHNSFYGPFLFFIFCPLSIRGLLLISCFAHKDCLFQG